MRWRIYYGDGSTYEGDSDKDAFAAPCISAIILKQETDNDRGYTRRNNPKYLVWERIGLSDGTILEEGRWGAKDDDIGLYNYFFTHVGPQKVLIGVEIHDDTFVDISRKVDSDGCLCLELCNHLIPGIGRA